LLYTGDFNNRESNLLWHFDEDLPEVELLITESTYGCNVHEKREEIEKRFIKDVLDVLDKGGVVLLPSFAIGRAQEIILMLAKWGIEYPIFLDGMAQSATKIVIKRRSAKNTDWLKDSLKKVKLVKKRSHRAKALDMPSIIVSPAGMLDGGNVRYYLERIYNNPMDAIFLTGYQVEGTQGRLLLDEGKITINEEAKEVKAKVNFYNFSAHTDFRGIIKLIELTIQRELLWFMVKIQILGILRKD
jgi:putative mRNA 3-end processing factor